MNTKKTKVLITGATGFIGRNMLEYFANQDDFEVYGSYHNSSPTSYPGVTMTEADLTKKDDVDKVVAGMDIIIQAAATTSGAKDIINKPYYHVTDNAIMNSLILRGAYEYAVTRVVFFSCSVMYQPSDAAVKEKDFDANREIFPSYFGVGWTKVYVEKMCEFYSRISNTAYTVIRHSNIYGPYDKYDLEKSHVFGATLTKVLTAVGDTITVWGDGREERDLLYISDLVDAVRAAITRQQSRFELLNVGYGQSIPVRDLVAKIIEHSGKKLTIAYDMSKPTIKTKLYLDCARAKELLGWSPKISLDEGIIKTLAWYRAHILSITP